MRGGLLRKITKSRQEKRVSSCARGRLDWTFRKISFLQGLSSPGIGCPRKVVELPSLKVFKGCAVGACRHGLVVDLTVLD